MKAKDASYVLDSKLVVPVLKNEWMTWSMFDVGLFESQSNEVRVCSAQFASKDAASTIALSRQLIVSGKKTAPTKK